MSETSSLRETLDFEERIVLSEWSHRNCSVEEYYRMHADSLARFEEFWASVARELDWFKPFEKTLEPGEYLNVYKQFVGERLNPYYLCLDRHVEKMEEEQSRNNVGGLAGEDQ